MDERRQWLNKDKDLDKDKDKDKDKGQRLTDVKRMRMGVLAWRGDNFNRLRQMQASLPFGCE